MLNLAFNLNNQKLTKNSVDFGTSKAWRIRFHIEEDQLYQMNTANVSISTWELEQVIFTNCTRSISHYSTYSFIILTLLKVRGGLLSEKPIPRKNPNSEDKKKSRTPGIFSIVLYLMCILVCESLQSDWNRDYIEYQSYLQISARHYIPKYTRNIRWFKE